MGGRGTPPLAARSLPSATRGARAFRVGKISGGWVQSEAINLFDEREMAVGLDACVVMTGSFTEIRLASEKRALCR